MSNTPIIQFISGYQRTQTNLLPVRYHKSLYTNYNVTSF